MQKILNIECMECGRTDSIVYDRILESYICIGCGAVWERRKNGRMKDAAPDMLEALQYCQAWFEKHAATADLINGKQAELPMLTAIKAAIAKATGN